MISIPEARKLLEEDARGMTDEQVGQILNLQYRIADIIFDRWLKHKKIPTDDLIKKRL